jgi:hypothetical protein
MTLPNDIPWRSKYDPAMKILDEAEAREYFEACVEHRMRWTRYTREEAEAIERENLRYCAFYCDVATQARVDRLFLSQ